MESVTSIWTALSSRQSFVWDNPNYAGAFLVLLALTLWGLFFIRPRTYWFCLIVNTTLAFLIVLTQSRGSIVGLFFGLVLITPCIHGAGRRFIPLITIGLIVMVGSFWMTKAGDRLEKGLSGTDGSVNNRLTIWKEVPAMVAQSPGGWGMGNSAEAYHQWYQPVGQDYHYKHLVNSHLTWLVELNWPGRFLYLSIWISILILAKPAPGFPFFSVAFSVWAAFALMSSFSGVAQQWYEWILPGLILTFVLGVRFRNRLWPSRREWLGVLLYSALFLISLYLYGRSQAVLALQGSDAGVRIGSSAPCLVIFHPSDEVLGKKYGHRIREGISKEDKISVVVSRQGSSIIPKDSIAVLSGKLDEGTLSAIRNCQARGLIFINPELSPELVSGLPGVPSVVIWGQLRQKGGESFWKGWAEKEPYRRFHTIEGSAEYIPSWFLEARQSFESMTKAP